MTDELPAAIDDVERDWSPRGEADVERALRGLDRLAARYESVRSQAADWRGDIDRWEADEVARLRDGATGLLLGLEGWGRDRRILSGGRDKVFRFPSGTIETRAGRGKVEVVDEAALIAWCEAPGSVCGHAVKVVKSVLTSVLMKIDGVAVHPDDADRTVQRLLCDGEEIPGVRYLAGGEARIGVDVKLSSQRALPAGGS